MQKYLLAAMFVATVRMGLGQDLPTTVPAQATSPYGSGTAYGVAASPATCATSPNASPATEGLLSKTDHLHIAAEHLEAAGFHDEAERFRREEAKERARRASDFTQIAVHVRMMEFSRNELSNLDSQKYGGSKGTSVLKLLEHLQGPQGKPGDLAITKNADAKLRALIEALRKDGHMHVLSEPDLISIAGRPGYILEGGEIGYQEKDAEGNEVTRFKEYGNRLDFVALVVAKGQIHLDLRIRKSEPDTANSVGGIPAFRTREIEAGVNVGSGDTVVINGGIEQRTRPASLLASIGEMLGVGSGPKIVEEFQTLVTVKAEIVPKDSAMPIPTR